MKKIQKEIEELISHLQGKGYDACIIGSRVLSRAGLLGRKPNDWDVGLPFEAHKEAIAFLERKGWKNNPDDDRIYYGVSLLGLLHKKDCLDCPSIDLVRADFKKNQIDGLYINCISAIKFAIRWGGVLKKKEIMGIALRNPGVASILGEKIMEYARKKRAENPNWPS